MTKTCHCRSLSIDKSLAKTEPIACQPLNTPCYNNLFNSIIRMVQCWIENSPWLTSGFWKQNVFFCQHRSFVFKRKWRIIYNRYTDYSPETLFAADSPQELILLTFMFVSEIWQAVGLFESKINTFKIKVEGPLADRL